MKETSSLVYNFSFSHVSIFHRTCVTTQNGLVRMVVVVVPHVLIIKGRNCSYFFDSNVESLPLFLQFLVQIHQSPRIFSKLIAVVLATIFPSNLDCHVQ